MPLITDSSVDPPTNCWYIEGMKLKTYLNKRDESENAFSRRSGIPQSTVNVICQGKGTLTATAAKIVLATDGKVGFADLVGEAA